jgi:two-component system chemotaxis response regulator CheB
MAAVEIKVLVADDSLVTRTLVVKLLESEPDIRVIGTAHDGLAAIEFLASGQRPDIVVMDIHMPRLNGFEATRRIMETHPLPIIICTATADPQELATAFRSLEAGAVACIKKPVALGPDFEICRRNLLQSVRLMSEVKVVRRWNRARGTATAPASIFLPPGPAGPDIQLIGIGASTGGPPALQTILSGLPPDFSVPILIVQHIAQGFLPAMVEWLSDTTGRHVHVATHGTLPLPGNAYIAPDDFHLAVDGRGHITLTRTAPENGMRPAVSHLFRSLADMCGPRAIGVLLTGMGTDGAAELKLMRDRGAFTIAQDQGSSVVHGMPREAIELGAATQVLPADKVAGALILQVERRRSAAGEIQP